MSNPSPDSPNPPAAAAPRACLCAATGLPLCGPSSLSRRRFLAAAALGVAASTVEFSSPTIVRAAQPQWGELVGRFRYRGPIVERAKLTIDRDCDYCGQFDIRDESLMVGDDQGLQNVFVYLRTPRVEVHPELAESVEKRVTLDNLDCIFKPHCLTIWQEKQEFYILNSDPIAQNVAFSPLGDTPANIVMGIGGDATYDFHRKQLLPVPIACNYHPWESAYILPRDNPYAAISGPDGVFRIAQLPLGKLEFQLWQERVGPLDAPPWKKGRLIVEIKPGVNDLGTIEIEPDWVTRK